jgi:transposase
MPEAYTIELRQRVVKAYEAGEGSYPVIAALFSVGEASVKRWVLLFGKTGSVAPQRKGGGTPSSIALEELQRLLSRLRDPTAGELAVEFNRTRRGKAKIHVSSIKRALHRHGYVVKKSADGRWRVCAQTSLRSGKPS